MEDPKVGEIWLRVETGHMYRITETYRHNGSGYYGGAVRVRPPQAGCDTTYEIAVWPSHVYDGSLLKIENPSDEDKKT